MPCTPRPGPGRAAPPPPRPDPPGPGHRTRDGPPRPPRPPSPTRKDHRKAAQRQAAGPTRPQSPGKTPRAEIRQKMIYRNSSVDPGSEPSHRHVSNAPGEELSYLLVAEACLGHGGRARRSARLTASARSSPRWPCLARRSASRRAELQPDSGYRPSRKPDGPGADPYRPVFRSTIRAPGRRDWRYPWHCQGPHTMSRLMSCSPRSKRPRPYPTRPRRRWRPGPSRTRSLPRQPPSR